MPPRRTPRRSSLAPPPSVNFGGMSSGGDLRKFPNAKLANEVGLRAGPSEMRTTSGFAVTSFVFGLIGGFVLGIIFGALAMGRTGPTGQRGRWMAVTGLVLSGLWIIGIAGGVVVHMQTSADRDASGEIVGAGDVSTDSLRAGDCLEEGIPEGSVIDVRAVPCSEPHRGEVIGTFELEMDEYPGLGELDAVVGRECTARFAEYSATTEVDPDLYLQFIHPEERAWPDDRTVVCIVSTPGRDRTGSLADL